jgi:hypothetical protein
MVRSVVRGDAADLGLGILEGAVWFDPADSQPIFFCLFDYSRCRKLESGTKPYPSLSAASLLTAPRENSSNKNGSQSICGIEWYDTYRKFFERTRIQICGI